MFFTEMQLCAIQATLYWWHQKRGEGDMIKYALLFLSFSALLAYGVGCASVDHGVAEQISGKAEIRLYEVFGMDCPGCHGALEKLVNKIPAVQRAEANWKEQRVMVTVVPGAQLNDQEIYDAIQDANFTPGKRIK